MDLLSQALLGATCACAIARPGERGGAALAGVAGGLAPDLDVLISSRSDPLLALEFHRHFTHAVIFAPLGAALVSLALWPWLRSRLRPPRLYLLVLAGYLSAPLIDACTSYGTHLLWPFSDQPVALGIISIVDPAFTLTLLAGLLLLPVTGGNRSARMALLAAGAYLCFAAFQSHRVEETARDLMARRGHHTTTFAQVKPSFGNVILWRSLYVHEGRLYSDGIRHLPGFGTRIYAGESRQLLDLKQAQDMVPGPVARQDLNRFYRFAAHLVISHPDQPGVLGDGRFSMLPTRIRPLWGVRLTARSGEDGHLEQVTTRSLDGVTRARFLAMLLGTP